MRTPCAAWNAFVDRQHRYPTGLVGQIIGERMLRQHTPETNWSIDLLQLQPADRVLEIGFGAGRGLALVGQSVPAGRITGMDVSATMIRAAIRRNWALLRTGRLGVLRGDIGALPFAAKRFEKIFSIHTFYFWDDPLAVCLQLANLLTRGGRFVSSFATARTRASGARVYWPIHQRAEAVVAQLQRQGTLTATLRYGPDSRAYNNVALVVDRV